jgi:hypothetical protein
MIGKSVDDLVDRRGVDVDMCLAAASRAEVRDAAGDPVVEARADVDHQVAAMHREVGLVEPVHPQHAEPLLARGRVGAEAHQRRGDRKARGLHQFAQELAGLGPGIDHAAAGVEDRALGGFHRLDQRLDRGGVALHARLVVVDPGLGFFRVAAGGELHVLRDVDQHRPGAAMGGDVERLVDRADRRSVSFTSQFMLGAGPRDADGVGLLERVGADHEGRHLARQNDDRDRIHQRVGQAGDGVGRAGAGGHEHDPGLAGGARIAFGGMHRALFVAHEDVADGVLLEDLVIDRQDRAAGIAEYDVDALILEGLTTIFAPVI